MKVFKSICSKFIQGDILDQMLLGRLVAEYEIRSIIHPGIHFIPQKPNIILKLPTRVNVEGTLNLLRLAVEQAAWQGKSVKFIYPSSIATIWYSHIGIKKNNKSRYLEDQWLQPTTMYGCK